MKKRLFIVNRDVYEEVFTQDSWDYLLDFSKKMALERRANTEKTFDGSFHIVYGYVCPNLGYYVSIMEFMDDDLFARFVQDLENKDKDVMIYAVHSITVF